MNGLPPDLKPKRWYQEFEFEDSTKHASYTQFMAEGSRGPLTVALWCITALLVMATARDIYAPTEGQNLVIKHVLRATMLAFCLGALSALKMGWVRTAKRQVQLTDATILFISFLAWLTPLMAGQPNAAVFLGIYLATTSVLMMGISSTIRGSTPVTLFALFALLLSPIPQAIPAYNEDQSIVLAYVVIHITSFSAAIHSHFSIRQRELQLFEAIWLSNTNLKKSNNANKSKRIFFTAIAHDYRQPLSALQTYIDVAVSLHNKHQAQPIPALLEKIQTSTSNIIGNLADLLQLSALDAASDKPSINSVDLNALATRVVDLYRPAAEENGVSIAVKIRGQAAKAQTNEVLLGQLLANFLGNSIKHHRENVPTKKVHLTITYTSDFITICVADNGKGMGLSRHPGEGPNGAIQRKQFGSEIILNAIENLRDHKHRQRFRLNAYTVHQTTLNKSEMKAALTQHKTDSVVSLEPISKRIDAKKV